MADRMTAEIAIGGPVLASLIESLVAVIRAEAFDLWGDDTSEPGTARELLAVAQSEGQPGTLRLTKYEAIGGYVSDLENFLVAHGITFDPLERQQVRVRRGTGPVPGGDVDSLRQAGAQEQ